MPLARGGDLDHDGYHDLAFARWNAGETATEVIILYGGAQLSQYDRIDYSGSQSVVAKLLAPPAGKRIGASILTIDDPFFDFYVDDRGDTDPSNDVAGVAIHLVNFHPHAGDELLLTRNPAGSTNAPYEDGYGYVFGGDAFDDPAAAISGDPGPTQLFRFVTLPDGLPARRTLFADVVGLPLPAWLMSRQWDLIPSVVGDINGDGLEDLAFSMPWVAVPLPQLGLGPVGTTFLILGRTNDGPYPRELALETDATRTVHGVCFGAGALSAGRPGPGRLRRFRPDAIRRPRGSGSRPVASCSAARRATRRLSLHRS